MRVIFCSDDDNDTTRAVASYLAHATDLEKWPTRADWPAFSREAAQRVASGHTDRAVLMCWTGTGTSMAANKVAGARAAQASDTWIAEHSRKWNDANILTLSLKQLDPDLAVDCVKAFLSVEAPDSDELANISAIE